MIGKTSKSKKESERKVESAAHYAGVMLEEIRDKVQLVAEAVQMTREHLEEKIESGDRKLSGEIGDLKTGMRVLNEKIDGVEKRLDAKIDGVEKRLDAKIDGVAKQLDTKIDGVAKQLDTKIEKVQKDLSEKINDIGIHLDRHESDIRELRLRHEPTQSPL